MAWSCCFKDFFPHEHILKFMTRQSKWHGLAVLRKKIALFVCKEDLP